VNYARFHIHVFRPPPFIDASIEWTAKLVQRCPQRHPISPLALEPGAASHHGDTLIHDPLSYSEVFIHPAFELFAVRDFLGFEARAERQSVMFRACIASEAISRQPGTSLHTRQKSRDEDGVECVVC
jgi:hypothetical protein